MGFFLLCFFFDGACFEQFREQGSLAAKQIRSSLLRLPQGRQRLNCAAAGMKGIVWSYVNCCVSMAASCLQIEHLLESC